MLITIKKKHNNGSTKMNLTGVAAPHITGTKIIEHSKDLHNYSDEETWIDHKIETPRGTELKDIFVIYADSTR